MSSHGAGTLAARTSFVVTLEHGHRCKELCSHATVHLQMGELG